MNILEDDKRDFDSDDVDEFDGDNPIELALNIQKRYQVKSDLPEDFFEVINRAEFESQSEDGKFGSFLKYANHDEF